MKQMERTPQFEAVSETPYGSILRRVEKQHQLAQENFGAPEYEALDAKGKGRLQMALALAGALGMAGISTKAVYDYQSESIETTASSNETGISPTQTTPTVEKEAVPYAPTTSLRPQTRPEAYAVDGPTETREDSQEVAASTAEPVPDSGNQTEEQTESLDNPEAIPFPEATEYGKRLEGYIARLQLQKDEVLFLDEFGAPVGAPVAMEEVIGPLPEGKTVKEGQVTEYKYSPGEIGAGGFPVDGVVPEWMDYIQELQVAKYPERTIADRTHVVTDFQAIFKDADLTDLQERVVAGEIESYEDVLDYFIEQPFAESEGLNRIDYLRAHMQFRSTDEAVQVSTTESVTFRAVPPEVQERLLFYIPGLLAQESKFNDDIENQETGATGVGQIIQTTWERYTGEAAVSKEFARQVEVMGLILSDMYDRVLDKIDANAQKIIRSQFASEREYQLEFVTRVTVAAYNNGPDRIAAVINRFVESVQVADMAPDADLFMAVTEFGRRADGELLSGYKTDSAEYVERVEAGAFFLADKYPTTAQHVAVTYGDGEALALNN